MSIAPSYAKSVTRGDYNDNPRSGGSVYHLFAPLAFGAEVPTLAPDLPALGWSNASDRVMRSAVKYESLWAAAIGAGIAQSVGMTFEIDGGRNNKQKYKNLLLYSNGGRGWKLSFLPQIKTDFLSTRMGFVIEIARTNKSQASQVTGLYSLDACRCRRTGDPDFPIIYTDLKGRDHIMPWYTVAYAAHMPSSDAAEYELGTPAAAIAWQQIVKLAAMERYIAEKITGRGVQSLELIKSTGLRLDELIDASKLKAEQDQAAEGAMWTRYYMGSILTQVTGEDLQHISIPLKGFPDGFQAQEERGWAINIYANAVGLDPQVLAPLVGGELGGTSRQSETLREYRQQRTGITFDESVSHVFNDWIIPNDNQFYFVDVDLNQLVKQAEADTARIAVLEGLRRLFPSLPEEKVLAMAADHDLLPKEMVAEDMRQFDGLSEDEKIKRDQAEEQSSTQVEPEQVATKADDDLDSVIDSELEGALEWARAIQSDE